MIPLFVTGCGAVTALGLDAARTVASLRAGLDGLAELPFGGQGGRDLRAVPIRGYAEGLFGLQRFEALAARALGPCVEKLRAEEPRDPVVLLGLPAADRPGVDPQLAAALALRLQQRFQLPPQSIRTISVGRTSALSAVKQAEALLKTGPHACVVGAVDSLLHPADLRHLSERGVLLEEYDGFLPGEAAAFVCLSRRSTAGAWGRKAVAVTGAGEADEPADGSVQAPLVGVGLSTAMRRALDDARVTEANVGLFINAVNGTRAEFEDDAHARIRLLRTPRDALEIWHLASSLGETGAAYGALALIWASAAVELGFAPAPEVLISATESGGARRAALYLQGQGDGKLVAGGPAVGLVAPALHVGAPISSTATLADDPGIRVAGTDDLHLALAERNLDGLASLLAVRDGHFRSDSPWADIDSFERRALAHLDAVAWGGEAMQPLLDRYLGGEWEEAAAAALVLCCAGKPATAVDALIAACETSDEHRAHIVEVAALSPRPVAEAFLRRLVERGGPGARDALWGLTIAGWLDRDSVERQIRGLAGPTPDFAVALARLGLAAHGPWVGRWVASLDGALPPEATLAATWLEPRWFHTRPAAALLETAPEALALASLAGGESLLTAIGDRPPTRGAMIALGWGGEIAGVPLLLRGLRSEADEVTAEAASALARIYGPRPEETVTVKDDEGDESSEDRLCRDPKRWEAIVAAAAATAPPRGRWRRGQPWTKRSALEMALDPDIPMAEHAIALWEHALVNREPPPTHARQWVSVQQRDLEARARNSGGGPPAETNRGPERHSRESRR